MKLLFALLLCGAVLVSSRRAARRNLGAYVGKIPSPLRYQFRQSVLRAACAVGCVVGAVLAPLWFLRDQQTHVALGPIALTASLGIIGGLVVGVFVVNVGFVVVGALRKAPRLPLEPGELARFAAKANQVFGGEHRPGTLVLTTTRLAFCPSRFAVQREPWAVPLSGIEEMECPGTTLLVIRGPALAEPGLFLMPSSTTFVERLRECGVGLEPVSSEHAAW